MIRIPRLPLLLPLVVAAPLGAAAQTLSTSSYACRFVEVPVRDGVHLHTSICAPRSTQEKLPFLLTRTPYGIGGDTVVGESYRFLAADGYIFVGQDIRGRYGSEGQWSMNRPLHDPADSAGVDEATDTYDTVEWLLKNVPDNNGRLGALGVSYPGFLATMAGINPHPAVKAISPQAPMTDTWMGDDFFHQGAFRPTQAVLYSGYIEGDGVALPEGDPYQVYRRYPTLDSLAAAAGVAALPSWNGFREHPSYDEYWRARALQRALTHATVPTLIVGGWWDEEDILGAQLLYRFVREICGCEERSSKGRSEGQRRSQTEKRKSSESGQSRESSQGGVSENV